MGVVFKQKSGATPGCTTSNVKGKLMMARIRTYCATKLTPLSPPELDDETESPPPFLQPVL